MIVIASSVGQYILLQHPVAYACHWLSITGKAKKFKKSRIASLVLSVLLGALIATMVIFVLTQNPLFLVMATVVSISAIIFALFAVFLCVYLGYQRGIPHNFFKAYLLFAVLTVLFYFFTLVNKIHSYCGWFSYRRNSSFV